MLFWSPDTAECVGVVVLSEVSVTYVCHIPPVTQLLDAAAGWAGRAAPHFNVRVFPGIDRAVACGPSSRLAVGQDPTCGNELVLVGGQHSSDSGDRQCYLLVREL